MIASLAPIKLNSTVLATLDLQLPPDVQAEAFRHSGNEFASAIVVPGATPRVRFRTPFKPAYDLIGLKGLPLTVFDVHLAKFSSGFRSSGSDHPKLSLNTSAQAFAYITRVACADRGIALAEVEVVVLSSNGMANPLSAITTGALPSLAAQPSLHTLGTTVVNGSTIAGGTGFSWDFGPEISLGLDGAPGDGLLYHTAASYLGGAPMLDVEHGDPISALTNIGYLGSALTGNFVQWLRTYDAATKVALATGLSLTVADGRVLPADIGAGNGRVATGGIRCMPTSTSGTHPVVVSTGTVP
ncbi:MAG: hypothetical protein H0W48_00520 [Methylibium sp.]|nr:hypothetical protein [Methylibium sp.]